MKKIFFLLILNSFVCNQSFSCLNGASKVLKDGTFLYQDGEGNVPTGHVFENSEKFEKGILQLDSLYKATKDLDYLSDKGLLFILLKQYKKAIDLYLEIEKIEPNRYSTASNIGTAYELIGQNENALSWINKAIKINPAAHNNSEWIHANILQAKIQGDSLINSSFLIKTKFTWRDDENSDEPETKLSKVELQNLADALYYQLNERVSFIKGKDKIISKLMFYLGEITYLQKNYADALTIYSFARNYADEEFHKQIDEKISFLASIIAYEKQYRNADLFSAKKNIESHAKLEKIYIQELKTKTVIIYILVSIMVLFGLIWIFFKVKNNR